MKHRDCLSCSAMLLGLAVFLFICTLAFVTRWRVHGQLCDMHLAAMPCPQGSSISGAFFRHAALLFQADSASSFLMLWRRPTRRLTEYEKKMKPGSTRPPLPVAPRRALEVLHEWTAMCDSTFRILLFGRRCIVTSAPAFARRVLHTHYKLYKKDPSGDPNTQFPPSLSWFIGYDGLFTRSDSSQHGTHAAARVGFARALLSSLGDPSSIRQIVRASPFYAENPQAVTLQSIQRTILTAVLRALVGVHAIEAAGGSTMVEQLHAAMTRAAIELDTEIEAPWRRLWVRIVSRKVRSQLHSVVEPAIEQCMQLAKGGANDAANDAVLPPIAQYIRTETPKIPSNATAADIATVDNALRRAAKAELLTALFMAYRDIAPTLAWALHYAALPQNHSLVDAIRREARDDEESIIHGSTRAGVAPGAIEAIQEVLRLHPPHPILTRVTLNDDIVPLSDLGIAADKLDHDAAATYDTVSNTSFAKRSGCLVIPSSAVVIINLDLLLKRADLFGPNAGEFHPRRFLSLARDIADAPTNVGEAAGGTRDQNDPKTWFVRGGFSIGARGCPAAHWALPFAAELLREALRNHDVMHDTRRRPSSEWALLLRPSLGS